MIIEIKGYNDNDLEVLRKEYIKTPHFDWKNATKDEKINDRIISCYEMVISCLTYKQGYSFYKDGELQRYGNFFVEQCGLSEDMVKNIFLTEKKFFEENANVEEDIFTDSEKVTYNSVIWNN